MKEFVQGRGGDKKQPVAQMAEEGVAKKEMARRTGLAVPTVRKYLKMLESEGIKKTPRGGSTER